MKSGDISSSILLLQTEGLPLKTLRSNLMTRSHYTPEEIALRGEAVYVCHIHDKLNPKHMGEFVVIDIETTEYEIHADDLTATKQLLARIPNAIIYGLRIDYPTAYHIGVNSS